MTGDVFLFDTLDGGEISYVDGQPVFDGGLQTAVYISLFSRSDWWGNLVAEDDERFESQLHTLFGRKLTNATRLDAIELVKQSLDWMLRSGLAGEFTVEASIPDINLLLIEILIIKPSGVSESFRFEINWQNELLRPVLRPV